MDTRKLIIFMEEKGKLHRLINSLTTGEKGYIKKNFSCETKEGAIYLKLFKIIASKGYNTNQKLEEKIPNLRYTKHYLYKLILNLLSDYHSNSLTEISINNSLNHLEVLYKKELFKDFNSNLCMLKSTCYRYENFTALMRILKLERKFLNSQNYDNFNADKLAENHEEFKSVLAKIENLNEYRLLSKKLFFIIKSKGPIRTEEDLKDLYEIMKNPLLISDEKALTEDAKMSFYKSNAYYRIIRKEYIEAYVYNKKLLMFFRMYPEKIRNSPKDYLKVLSNHLHLCINTKNFAEYEQIFTEYSGMMCCGSEISLQTQLKLLDTRLSYYLRSFQLEKAEKLIDGTKIFYDDKDQVNTNLLLNFTFNIIYFYILNRQPEKALFYIHCILNESKDKDSEILYFTKILNLIVHYKLENFSTLETLVVSTYKYLYKRKKIFKFENLVLKFIKNSYKISDKKESDKLTFKKEMKELILGMIDELKKLNADPFQSSYKEMFDFQSWLESRAKGIEFCEVLRNAENKPVKNNTSYIKAVRRVKIAG